MTTLLGAIFLAFVFLGGGVTEHNLLAGLGLTAVGAIGLGTMFAAVKSAALAVDSLDSREGLTLDQLWKFLNEAPALKGDTRVYVGDSGLHPAGAVFACILDGHRTVVIERRVEESEAVHDLF